MKIRGKIVILELVVALLLFIALFITIGLYATITRFEEIEVRYHASFSSLDEVIHTTRKMILSETEFLSSFLVLEKNIGEFSNNHSGLKVSIKATRMDSNFKKEQLKKENEVTRILSNEKRADLYRRYQELILLDDQALLRDNSLSEAKHYLTHAGQTDTKFFLTLNQFISDMNGSLTELETYRIRLGTQYGDAHKAFVAFRKANIMMSFINAGIFALVVLGVILLFSASLTSKIKRIDKAFQVIASGDFSASLDMTSDDEFGTLSRNFNTLVSSLWTKLESLRQIMHDVGESISNEIDLTRVENTIVYLAQKNTTANGVALYKIVGEDRVLRLQYAIGDFRPPYKSRVLEKAGSSQMVDMVNLLKQEPVGLRGNILGETVLQAKSQFIRNIGLNRAELKKEPDDPLYISSCISIPLKIGNNILGVLCLVKTKGFELFSDLEYSNMQSFAELSAIVIDNLNRYSEMLEAFELNREIGIAAEIQQNLKPSRIPEMDNYEIAYLYKPQKGINGDFFDIIPLGFDRVLVVLCEVAGKGVPAALVMVMVRTILRLIASPEKSAGELLTELNRNITERVQIENYASLGLLILNKKNNTLSFSAASQNALSILRNGSETFESHDVGGIPVGIEYDSTYKTVDLSIDHDDLLVMFTDGIPEARNKSGREYTSDTLLEMISKNASKDSQDIVGIIEEDLDYFEKGSQSYDDKTLFILKYKGWTNENQR
jgi:serine phosphatase RsbU (regulator of sigma subunit)/HAMP domain-containing protein